MSKTEDKFAHSKRIQNDMNAINKQLKIAKQSGHDKYIKEPHRMVKHHAMDCGNPQCGLCGNPRHIQKDGLTQQEKKAMQDIENVKITNGAINDQDL